MRIFSRFTIVFSVLALTAACIGRDSNGTAATGTTTASKSGFLTSVKSSVPKVACPDGGIQLNSGYDTDNNGTLEQSEIASVQYVCNSTGSADFSMLVSVTGEAAGKNCANGGEKVSAGDDSNNDGILETSEISSSDYVCAKSAAGPKIATSLLSVVSEPSGTHCATGGVKVSSGLDLNKNSILDLAEISSTQYVCNGLNTLTLLTPEPAGATCAAGGVKVQAGLDSNGNNTLDPAEVTSTQYVCNGTSGSNGLTALIDVTDEPAGDNCTYGGKKISTGMDSNGNGSLDPAEVTSTDYVCNGQGGTGGTNGLNSLIKATPETQGANCITGGIKIETGLDTNANNVLDPGEVASTSYVCNGGPGWIEVTGTYQQAVSNMGYLANNASEVTIMLPPSPAIGDTVRVTGAGMGGWKLGQNTGQSIITKDLPETFGDLWTYSSIVKMWTSVASSYDGKKLVATELGQFDGYAGFTGGQIYISTDAGKTWTPHESNRIWSGVASSADGTKLVAVVNGGQIYTSMDSGQTWSPRDSNRNWSAVASSSDGTKLVAAVAGGQIYTSTDAGLTWTPRDSNRSWTAVISSSDGSKLAALTYASPSGEIYTSDNSGQTWTSAAMGTYTSIAMTSDGSTLFAIDGSGQLYYSIADYAWNYLSTVACSSIAASSDGARLICRDDRFAFTSIDSGRTWTQRISYSDHGEMFSTCAISGDGSTVMVAEGPETAYFGFIFISRQETSIGTAGSLSGGQYDAVEVQYVGNGRFTVLNHEGTLSIR